MKAKIVMGTRIILGLIFAVFGANGIMATFNNGQGFIPMPELTLEQMQMFGAFMTLKYLMPLVKALEVIAGLLLIFNRYVNLALVLLGPIVVNILCVHVFLDPSGIWMALAITALTIFQICSRWDSFRPLLAK